MASSSVYAFSGQLANRGLELYQEALHLMKTCPERCDASCYRCMRSFKNKFEHSLLDRHVGAQLLAYLIVGEESDFSEGRLEQSTTLLHHDLQRQSDGTVEFRAGVSVSSGGMTVQAPILAECAGGRRVIIALSGPLTTDYPADLGIRELRDNGGDIAVIVENELLVRGNLPAATRDVQQRLSV